MNIGHIHMFKHSTEELNPHWFMYSIYTFLFQICNMRWLRYDSNYRNEIFGGSYFALRYINP